MADHHDPRPSDTTLGLLAGEVTELRRPRRRPPPCIICMLAGVLLAAAILWLIVR